MAKKKDITKQCILDYASNHGSFGFSQLVSELGIKTNTARQYLSTLTKEAKLMRVGNGEYRFADKPSFVFIPTEALEKLHRDLKERLPYTDFCIYDGSIFTPFQHHVSINHAIYIETNRDAVDTVFSLLKDSKRMVYKHPDAAFMYDYVNLQEACFIVKPFVTESPVKRINGLYTPTLEKILVDIQKDDDFDYMRGMESLYMYRAAFDMYVVNTQKLFRYAKRRGAYKSTSSLVQQLKKV